MEQIYINHKDGLILGGLLLVWVIVYFYQMVIRKAPIGYEDKNGFHDVEKEKEELLKKIAELEYVNELLKTDSARLRAEKEKAEVFVIKLKDGLKEMAHFLDKPTEPSEHSSKIDKYIEGRKVANGL
jgi:hypothetical protein